MQNNCKPSFCQKLPASLRTKVFLAVGATLLVTSFSAAAFDFVAPLQDPLGVAPPMLKEVGGVFGNGASPCFAQRNPANKLSLAEAVDLALCNNSQVKSAWASIKIQAAALGEASSAYLPTISGSISEVNTRSSYPGSSAPSATHNGRMINGALNWRLFDFGGREANKDAANHLLTAAIASHDATIRKTLQAVIQSYFDAQTAKALLAAKEEGEVIASGTLDTAKRRETHGAAARSDTLQATTALAKASLEKSKATGEYRKALAILAYVLGIQQNEPVLLVDELTVETERDIKDLETWLDQSKKSHPAIIASKAQLEAAKRKVVAAKSEGMPTVDFSTSFNRNGYPNQALAATETRSTTYGIALNIPLFDGFSRTYKIRGAQAQVEQKEAELLETERNTLVEIVKIYASASAALQNIRYAETLLVAAKESLNTSQRKYERGAADITEMLNTQAALTESKQEKIREGIKLKSLIMMFDVYFDNVSAKKYY